MRKAKRAQMEIGETHISSRKLVLLSQGLFVTFWDLSSKLVLEKFRND